MATRILRGTSTVLVATLNNGRLCEGATTREMAKISGDTVSRESQLLKVVGGKVFKGTSATQIARIDGSKIYRGTSATQVASVNNGRITEGTSAKQIAKIDGPYSIVELAAVLHLCLAVF